MRKGRFNWELAFRELQFILVRKAWEHETKVPHIPTSYKTVAGIGTQVISFKAYPSVPFPPHLLTILQPPHSTTSWELCVPNRSQLATFYTQIITVTKRFW